MTIDRRSFLKSAAAITAATVVTGCAKSQQGDNQSTPLAAQGKSVMGLAVPAMDVVRVGFIGVGQRGSGHVNTFAILKVLKLKLFVTQIS